MLCLSACVIYWPTIGVEISSSLGLLWCDRANNLHAMLTATEEFLAMFLDAFQLTARRRCFCSAYKRIIYSGTDSTAHGGHVSPLLQMAWHGGGHRE